MPAVSYEMPCAILNIIINKELGSRKGEIKDNKGTDDMDS
jgi:hypothetical protein